MTKNEKRVLSPIGDRVTVRETPADERSKGGIVLPDTARQTRYKTGVVVSRGGGVTSTEFEVGDTVVLAEYAGMQISVDDEKLLLVSTAEVVGRIGAPKPPALKPVARPPKPVLSAD